MRYELLLQAPAGLPYDTAKVDALLLARGAAADGQGRRVWRLGAGELEVGSVREAGNVVATELRVPLSDRPELLREALARGAELAREAGLQLVDPQLNRPVSEKDEAAVEAQFGRNARYAGLMLGVPEAIPAAFPVPPAGMGLGLKVLLFGGVLLLVVYLLLQQVASSLS